MASLVELTKAWSNKARVRGDLRFVHVKMRSESRSFRRDMELIWELKLEARDQFKRWLFFSWG